MMQVFFPGRYRYLILCVVFFTFLLLLAGTSAAQCVLNPSSPSVTICTPSNRATVSSPVAVVAGTTDAHTVTAIKVYLDNNAVYSVNAKQLSTSLSMSGGQHNITVNAWDSSGAVFKTTVIVTVSAAGTAPISVAISPHSATLTPGKTQQFTSTVLNSSNTAVSWSVDGLFSGNTTVGIISTSGFYTAGTALGNHTVVATSAANSTKSDSAIVMVTTTSTGGGACAPTSGPPSLAICSPVAGSTVTSPMHLQAVAASNTAITKFLVYVDGSLAFQALNSTSIDTSLSMSAGTHNLTVQYFNGVWVKQSENIVVSSALPPIKVSITAAPTTIGKGNATTLTVIAANATQVVISDNVDSTIYHLAGTGGTQSVTPIATTIYTATATDGNGDTATATVNVTVNATATVALINHVIFQMQENRSFDSYFGMLNSYRQKYGLNVADDGHVYNVDGIDDKLTNYNVDNNNVQHPLFHTISTCLDDMTSAWEESYGSVNRWDFSLNRLLLDDGFVHVAESFALSGSGSGTFTGDTTGERAMAYYQDTSVSGKPELNYYYYMASQFALSDRWFSPVSSKTKPNRLATMAGGTTQGLVKDPGTDDDKLPQRIIKTIFQQLQEHNVSWKIYYTTTTSLCNETYDADTCGSQSNPNLYPTTTFEYFTYSTQYIYNNPTGAACTGTTVGSKAAPVNDPENAFCIDTNHIAPLSQLYVDMAKGTLPAFAYIEPGYGTNDEHPGSGQSILTGQQQIAKTLNAFMSSPSWNDSVFFLARDISGGPYDHVPPVQGHSNDHTNLASMGYLPLGTIPDISTIAVNPDSYLPCVPIGPIPTLHCDLDSNDPGAASTDAASAANEGFAAQLGFRVPNIVVSPFVRKHYVSHVPMDHTAVIRFVEDRFIGNHQYLTLRDAAQPTLLDFFDFANVPWQIPPAVTSLPMPPAVGSTCTPAKMQ
jgi:phospholipase C